LCNTHARIFTEKTKRKRLNDKIKIYKTFGSSKKLVKKQCTQKYAVDIHTHRVWIKTSLVKRIKMNLLLICWCLYWAAVSINEYRKKDILNYITNKSSIKKKKKNQKNIGTGRTLSLRYHHRGTINVPSLSMDSYITRIWILLLWI